MMMTCRGDNQKGLSSDINIILFALTQVVLTNYPRNAPSRLR